MHTLFIGTLTVILVLDCILLILLVLLQLPKKEAGAGLAFGGAATDALFGAGSGTVLTRITKWVAGAFFGLTLLLAILGTKPATQVNSIADKLATKSGAAPTAVSQPVTQPADASKTATTPVKPAVEAPAPTAPTTTNK
jgi:preprotein translocase subunit SecG